MKKTLLLFIFLTGIFTYGFSQSVSYSTLIKKSIDSLSFQLKLKEKLKSYLVMDIVVKGFNSGSITIPNQFFNRYFNESFSNTNSELKKAFDDYYTNKQKFTNYFNNSSEYIDIMNLPRGNANELKIREYKLGGLRSRFYNNDVVYKNLFDKNNLYVKRYQFLVLSQLYNSYIKKDETFPVMMLGIDNVINNLTNVYSSIYSLNTEIETIKSIIQTMNRMYITDEVNGKIYGSKIIDSLVVVIKRNVKDVQDIPLRINKLEKKLSKLNTDYNNLIFDKFIEMRLTDSSAISIYANSVASNLEYINSIDSLRYLRKKFEDKDSVLLSILKSDEEYSTIYKKVVNRDISGEEFKNESSNIINNKFRFDDRYIDARRERERALFISNLAILRHLLKISSKDAYLVDYKIIPGNELMQIKSFPELFVMENEINNIKSVIKTSWNNYYYKKYSIPYVRTGKADFMPY